MKEVLGSCVSGITGLSTARTRTFLVAFACLLLPAPALLAQSLITGALTGTVTDPSSAVIPGASVLLKNAGTGASQERTTDAQGWYRFPLLAPGSYTVTANAPNFAETIRSARVSVGQTNVVDVQLSLQTAVTSIDVHEQVVTIQPASPNISHNVGANPLANVPNPGNDLTFYALLSPGVEMSTNGGPLGIFGNFSTFGLPALSNTFTLNGGINNDVISNVGNTGATNLMLGFNAIGEVTVVNNAYTGQYGGLAGSQVNYVFKSGTNNYHGNAIYFWNGRVMNANNWFNNQAGDPRPFSNVNTWATSVGGPLPKQKNKTFYFFDYEGTRIILPTNTLAKIPSPQFAAATLNNLSATGQTQAVPFYQNIFKLYASAAGANTATAVPKALGEKGGGCGSFMVLPTDVPCALEFRSNAGNFTNEYVWTTRVDRNLGSNDRLFVTLQRDNGTQATYTDPISPVFNAFSPQPALNGQISENHTFSSTVVNQLILTGQYYSTRFGPPDYAAVLAVFPTVIQFAPALFSNMGGTGYNWPQGRNVTQYQLIDDLSWTSGRA